MGFFSYTTFFWGYLRDLHEKITTIVCKNGIGDTRHDTVKSAAEASTKRKHATTEEPLDKKGNRWHQKFADAER
jgi:hypothetical protein